MGGPGDMSNKFYCGDGNLEILKDKVVLTTGRQQDDNKYFSVIPKEKIAKYKVITDGETANLVFYSAYGNKLDDTEIRSDDIKNILSLL